MRLLRKHLKLVIALPVLCAVAAAAVSWALLPNAYTASVSMYILTKSSGESSSITNSDLSASQMLTNDVVSLVKSDRVLADMANSLKMDSLSDYEISVESATTTRVLTVSVTGESAQTVAIVANELAETTGSAKRGHGRKERQRDRSGRRADVAFGSPRVMYTAVAFLAGLFLAVAIVVVLDMVNTRVRNAEEVEELLGVPVIGRIPVIKN